MRGFMDMAVRWKEMDSPSYEVTPVFTKVRKLLNEDWMTKLKATTDSNGIVKFNGFLGDYSLRYPLIAGGPNNAGLILTVDKYQSYPLTIKSAVLK